MLINLCQTFVATKTVDVFEWRSSVCARAFVYIYKKKLDPRR